MTNIASADSTDIGRGFSDILNLFHQAINRKQEFLTFMTPSATSPWEWEAGLKSLVFMFLSSFGATWEMLITKTQEQHGGNELNAVVKTYGRLLACFVQEDSLTYTISGVTQNLDSAKEVSAKKLRNALAHGRYELLFTGGTPWIMRFFTNWKNECHSFEISTSELSSFFNIVSVTARNQTFTNRGLLDTLKRMANDEQYPDHTKILYFKNV